MLGISKMFGTHYTRTAPYQRKQMNKKRGKSVRIYILRSLRNVQQNIKNAVKYKRLRLFHYIDHLIDTQINQRKYEYY